MEELSKENFEKLVYENMKVKIQLEEFRNQMITQSATISNLNAQMEVLKMSIELVKELTKNNNISKSHEEKKEVESTQKLSKPKKDAYEALLEFKAKQNKKELLKNKILSMVGNGINLAELKFLFVEHHNYCSKATFYNYVKELEIEKVIDFKKKKSKTYVYSIKEKVENEL